MHARRVALLACAVAVFMPVQAQARKPESDAQALAAQWRGVVVPPFPSGWQAQVGSCIGQGETPDALCATMVSVLKDEQSGIRTVFATRPLRHADGTLVGDPNRPLELVTDALEPPALEDPQAELSIGLCQRDGRDDRRIVAVAHPDAGTEWYTRLHGLWRLDDDGRFQPIPADGVRCLNEGYGYDG